MVKWVERNVWGASGESIKVTKKTQNVTIFWVEYFSNIIFIFRVKAIMEMNGANGIKLVWKLLRKGSNIRLFIRW